MLRDRTFIYFFYSFRRGLMDIDAHNSDDSSRCTMYQVRKSIIILCTRSNPIIVKKILKNNDVLENSQNHRLPQVVVINL